MSHEHRQKKQSFAPYAVIIIVAVVLISIANAIVVYNNNQASIARDSGIISSQNQVISSLSNTTVKDTNILNAIYKGDSKADIVAKQINGQLEAMGLYHAAIVFLLHNNTLALNNLIAAHNEMIKAIEEAAGVHTPTVIHNTFVHNTPVHNTYCSIYIVQPECHKKPVHK